MKHSLFTNGHFLLKTLATYQGCRLSFLGILDGNDEVNSRGDKIYFYVPLAIRLKTDGLV